MNEREKIFVLIATAAATENIRLLQEQTVSAKKIGISAIDIKEAISLANPTVTRSTGSSGASACCR